MSNPQADILRVCDVVSETFDVTVADITSPSRQAMYVGARWAVIWICHKLLARSVSSVVLGRTLGGRDHTTILSAIRRVGERDTVAGAEWEVLMLAAMVRCEAMFDVGKVAELSYIEKQAEMIVERIVQSVRRRLLAEAMRDPTQFVSDARSQSLPYNAPIRFSIPVTGTRR